MKDLILKNFNYALIDSAKSGYREVLVTYSVDGKTARQCIFIKEVSGKDKNYYLNEAKRQINERMANGTLAKNTKKQLKRTGSKGILKPVMITLAATLGVGALGAGGYFTYKYFTNPGGGDVPPGPGPGPGPEPTTGHTVVLLAGENAAFKKEGETDKTYLIFNNVPDGTKLGDIEGYYLPECGDYDFDRWQGPIIDRPYGEKHIITEDLVLTATFFEGINYVKSQAKNSIASVYKEIFDAYEGDDDVQNGLLEIYDTAVKTIDDLKTEGSEVSDIRSVVNDLTDFAISALDAVYIDGSYVDEIKEYFANNASEIMKESDTVMRLALSKFNAGYVKALPTAMVISGKTYPVDTAKDELKKLLEQAKDENDSLKERLLAHFGGSVIAGSGYYSDPDALKELIQESLKDIDSLLYSTNIRNEADADNIEWLGEAVSNIYYNNAKYHYHDPEPLIREEDNLETYEEYVKYELGKGIINCLYSYFGGGISAQPNNDAKTNITVADVSLLTSIEKCLANVEDYKLEGKSYELFPAFDYFYNVVHENSYSDVIDDVVNFMQSNVNDNIVAANKMIECFKNVLEALSIWNGDWDELYYAYGFEFLFAPYDGGVSENSANGGIIDDLTYICTTRVAPDQVDFKPFLDSFVVATEKAIDIAKGGSNTYYYEDLYYNLHSLVYAAIKEVKLKGVPTTYYTVFAPLLNDIFAMGVDSGFYYEGVSESLTSVFSAEVNKTLVKFYPAEIKAIFASALTMYSMGNQFYYFDVTVPTTNNFINGLIESIFSSQLPEILGKVATTNQIAVDNYGYMMQELLTNSTSDIFKILLSDKSGKLSNFEEYVGFVRYIVQQVIHSKMLEIFKNTMGSTYPDASFNILYDTIRIVFEKIPDLGTFSKMSVAMDGLLSLVLDCFAKGLDKATELYEEVVKDFTSKITKDMTEENLSNLASTTVAKCNEIISKR